MKKNLIIVIIFYLVSCKPSPTYNAFDDKFDISIREVIKNGCDTISAGCGFFNLIQKEGKLRNYYQIYVSDWNKVDAKGFTYFLDTLKVSKLENFNTSDLFIISEQEIKNLNSELIKYNYAFLDQKKNNRYLRIIEKDSRNTLNLDILTKWVNEKDSIIIRTIEYWKPNKEQH
ncbi:hypothetical protein [Tenacibaculum sp. 190524A02b]|uniref:hypothetical protein n=1 Tax=Tenacibaculum vairaonense TaxID=3137860 RepID=UPI0031FAAEF5